MTGSDRIRILIPAIFRPVKSIIPYHGRTIHYISYKYFMEDRYLPGIYPDSLRGVEVEKEWSRALSLSRYLLRYQCSEALQRNNNDLFIFSFYTNLLILKVQTRQRLSTEQIFPSQIYQVFTLLDIHLLRLQIYNQIRLLYLLLNLTSIAYLKKCIGFNVVKQKMSGGQTNQNGNSTCKVSPTLKAYATAE